MTAEVASEVSLCTCFHPRLWRSGTEGWNGAGVVRDRAGRGGWEDYSSRSAPRRLSLRGPAAETPPRGFANPRSSPDFGIPAPWYPQLCCSGFNSARGRPRSPFSACPALPFGAFPAVGVLFEASQKRGRPKPNPASGLRSRILCKWTA